MRTVIPVALSEIEEFGASVYIERIRQCRCDEIELVVNSTNSFEELPQLGAQIRTVCEEFHQAGIATSVWIHPTLFLIPFKSYTYLTTIKGTENKVKWCPMDDAYCQDVAQYVTLLLQHCGTKKLVLEDDFRMQFPRQAACCFCEHHLAYYSQYLGHPVTREEMAEHLDGAPDIYREAWVAGLQAGMVKLAKAIRAAADAVDPDVEIVFSTGPANCGADGTDVLELIDILKGKHPTATARLSGGPYWQEGRYLTRNLMAAVELERYTALQFKKRGIIGRAEGDCNPRPRHIVPAAHLECFHTALAFDGNCPEILKYMLDYFSSPRYEQGYTNAHIRNLPLYDTIEELVRDTEAVGFCPIEDFALQSYTHRLNPLPENEAFESCVRNFCADNALPTAHEGDGVNVLFGDRARRFDLERLSKGSVIDLVAAKVLTERGVDVGLRSAEECVFRGGREWFEEDKEMVSISLSFATAAITVDPAAQVKAYFVSRQSTLPSHDVKAGVPCPERIISTYLYENAAGQRFLVCNFDASQCSTKGVGHGVFNNYCRQRLLFAAYEWLHGTPPDACCIGHPWLYLQVRKSDTRCVVGLWNYCADDITLPVVQLGDTYREARFVCCDGFMDGNKVVLTSGLGAYKYGFIELIK